MQAIIETGFDIIYLSSVVIIGIMMIIKGRTKEYKLFGIMAITLGLGDAFHLIPRAAALLTSSLSANSYYLGIGKLITSITMTIFYIILYYVYRIRYDIKNEQNITYAMYILAGIRIAFCLLPGNEWTFLNPPLFYGILRNIPFAIMGTIIIVLFYKKTREYKDTSFKHMHITIILSFGFYLPVVLFSGMFPIIGALMIPKTLAYVWTILIGFNDMRMNQKERIII